MVDLVSLRDGWERLPGELGRMMEENQELDVGGGRGRPA